MRIVTRALVARSVDYGETDRILTLLTERHGKIAALARGAKKSRKRYGGALSLFVIGEATLQRATRRNLLGLESFEGLEDLTGPIARDVVKMAHGSYVLEAARELWAPDQPDRPCFELVCETLRVLAASPPAAGLLRAYELRLLEAVGLAPSLETCVGCGQPAGGGRSALYVSQGGVVCGRCAQNQDLGPPELVLDPDTRQHLSKLKEISLSAAAKTRAPAGAARQSRELMVRLMRQHLGRSLRSWDFLVQLAHQADPNGR